MRGLIVSVFCLLFAAPAGALDGSTRAQMARGELCLDSPLGRLELRIAPGLERLAARLRTLLSHDD